VSPPFVGTPGEALLLSPLPGVLLNFLMEKIMSNNVTIQPTKFVNIDPQTMMESEVSWGFRVYDDYDNIYTNFLSEEDFYSVVNNGLEEVISYIEDLLCDDIKKRFIDMIDFAREKGSIFYGGYNEFKGED
jgi:hypothetical protein